MIINLWTKVRLYCGNHPDTDEKTEMRPHEAPSGNMARSLYGSQLNMFYACPKYYQENRADGEKLCRNHISTKEFEGMLNHLAGILEKGEEYGGTINLVGEEWSSRQGVKFKVVKHTSNHIDVKCLNSKSLWKN